MTDPASSFIMLLVENKTIKKITNQNEAQLINYFKTTRLRVGLLIIQCNSVKSMVNYYKKFSKMDPKFYDKKILY